MAQDHGLCRTKVRVKWNRGTGRLCRPVLQLPTGQSCSLQTCCNVDPGAHGMDRGQSNTERGQMLRRAVGMAWQRRAGTQPAEQGTAGRHSRRTLRPAQASKTTASSWPASQQSNSCPQSWPASRHAVQVTGGSAVVLTARKAGADLPTVPTPPIAFACHCLYPLP